MAVHRVLQATDPRDEVVLRRKSSRVRRFDQALERLIADMVETMRAYRGVGLAAPQIGVLQRVIVAELPAEGNAGQEQGSRRPGTLFVLCNPEITASSPEEQVGEEGCLSLAGWYGEVARAQAVEVRFQDRHGRGKKMRAEGYLARILQHEIDHLEGILFTDRVTDLSTLVRPAEEGEEAPALNLVSRTA
ncbi:MAG: peptide deformylase [Chloroflexia bacterium]